MDDTSVEHGGKGSDGIKMEQDDDVPHSASALPQEGTGEEKRRDAPGMAADSGNISDRKPSVGQARRTPAELARIKQLVDSRMDKWTAQKDGEERARKRQRKQSSTDRASNVVSTPPQDNVNTDSQAPASRSSEPVFRRFLDEDPQVTARRDTKRKAKQRTSSEKHSAGSRKRNDTRRGGLSNDFAMSPDENKAGSRPRRPAISSYSRPAGLATHGEQSEQSAVYTDTEDRGLDLLFRTAAEYLVSSGQGEPDNGDSTVDTRRDTNSTAGRPHGLFAAAQAHGDNDSRPKTRLDGDGRPAAPDFDDSSDDDGIIEVVDLRKR